MKMVEFESNISVFSRLILTVWFGVRVLCLVFTCSIHVQLLVEECPCFGPLFSRP